MGSQQWRLSLSCVRRYYAGQFCHGKQPLQLSRKPLPRDHNYDLCSRSGRELGDLLSLFSIDLEQIEQQFALKARPFIMHGKSVPDHVISELYQVPDNIRLEYLRVKILELLVTLRTVDPTVLGVERPYFYKTQVEKVKAIMSFMTNEPEHHFTMEELSEKFDISTSALKQCFKGVYGTAIYTYMRNYRMDLATSFSHRRMNQSQQLPEKLAIRTPASSPKRSRR